MYLLRSAGVNDFRLVSLSWRSSLISCRVSVLTVGCMSSVVIIVRCCESSLILLWMSIFVEVMIWVLGSVISTWVGDIMLCVVAKV